MLIMCFGSIQFYLSTAFNSGHCHKSALEEYKNSEWKLWSFTFNLYLSIMSKAEATMTKKTQNNLRWLLIYTVSRVVRNQKTWIVDLFSCLSEWDSIPIWQTTNMHDRGSGALLESLFSYFCNPCSPLYKCTALFSCSILNTT